MKKQLKKSRKVKVAKLKEERYPQGTGTLGGIRSRRLAKRGLTKQ